MDKDQARFVLHSFRPDGADVEDPDFAEALKLAMENRELGEWLANERAFDAEFAQALGNVPLPGSLREDIMACLAAERGDFPIAEDTNDASWIGALATIQTPPCLRDEILAAMDRTVEIETDDSRMQTGYFRSWRPSVFRRAGVPLAAAAAVTLAFLITRPIPESHASTVPLETVQAGFVKTYDSPTFQLEERRENPHLLISALQKQKLPCPGKLLPGLRDKKGIGCRKLEVDGKSGSLICFKLGEQGVVHVLVFRRDDVSGYFPPKDDPEYVTRGSWCSVRWEDGEKVFILMSDNVTQPQLAALF